MQVAVLLSGGIDSAVTLYRAVRQGHDVTAVTVDYGQSHRVEVDAARHVAAAAGVSHIVVAVDAPAWEALPLLTGEDIPQDREGEVPEKPAQFVPARNAVLLSLAAGSDPDEVWFGANKDDYGGFPDCRRPFMDAMTETLKLGLGNPRFQVRAPYSHQTKRQVVAAGRRYGVPLELTVSCYHGTNCGRCDACQLRDEALCTS